VAKIRNSGGVVREWVGEKSKEELPAFRVLTAFHSSTLANRNEQLVTGVGVTRKAAADALEIQIKFTTVSRNFVNDAQHDADVCQTS